MDPVTTSPPSDPTEQARDFLTTLFGQGLDCGLHSYLWTLPSRSTHPFAITRDDLDNAAERAIRLGRTQDVYVGPGLVDRRLGLKERATSRSVVALPALWLDIDIAGPHHKKANLPPDEESAHWVLDAMGLAPSMLVSTGGGLHAWWVFREFRYLTDEATRKAATALSRDWNYTAQTHARTRGWVIDSTFDLARVMRVPGTVNHKAGGSWGQ